MRICLTRDVYCESIFTWFLLVKQPADARTSLLSRGIHFALEQPNFFLKAVIIRLFTATPLMPDSLSIFSIISANADSPFVLFPLKWCKLNSCECVREEREYFSFLESIFKWLTVPNYDKLFFILLTCWSGKYTQDRDFADWISRLIHHFHFRNGRPRHLSSRTKRTEEKQQDT